jgi:predicted Zn-ribbon and HTH transcriptional regulator
MKLEELILDAVIDLAPNCECGREIDASQCIDLPDIQKWLNKQKYHYEIAILLQCLKCGANWRMRGEKLPVSCPRCRCKNYLKFGKK